jgi:mono/diheme cytochrome c family protein|tara:strand:+ start:620 stop:1534 length:915 start_codon:yes stop_codon:yes gene_type:complete
LKQFLKWFGLIAGGLIGVAIVLLVVLFLIGSRKVNRTYDIEIASVAVPTDAESIAQGKHYVEALGACQVCHGQDLGGPTIDECRDGPCLGFSNDSVFGKVFPKNLTSGSGGIGGVFTDEDYVRAIRHGISGDNKSLVMMPSDNYNNISDEDLGNMIAYLKTLPPVDNEQEEVGLGLVGRILTIFAGGLIPASQIDHDAARPPSPEAGVTVEYGEYLSGVCSVCHGDSLSGGEVPSGDRVSAPNITQEGNPGSWTESQFLVALRSGMTPDGTLLDPRFMPWNRFNAMTDDELGAIWLYLQTLPAG